MANSSRLYCLILFTLLFSGGVHAAELKPWFGNQLEFEFRPKLLYQSYRNIDSASKTVPLASDDLFLSLSLSNSPTPEWSIELGSVFAHTSHKSNWCDHLQVTGRYMWMDDISGDPLSLVTGITYSQAFKSSLNDISSFHHGLYETEAHVSFGRERNCGTEWISRWWGVAAIGVAERGSPWTKARVDYQVRLRQSHQLGVFGRTLRGFGGERLNTRKFRGYGAVQHRSIDLGVSYRYDILFFGNIGFDYVYRLYAYNFPVNAHCITFTLFYPFGL